MDRILSWPESPHPGRVSTSKPLFLHLSRYREYHAFADIRGAVGSALEVVSYPYEAGGAVRCLGSTIMNVRSSRRPGHKDRLQHYRD